MAPRRLNGCSQSFSSHQVASTLTFLSSSLVVYGVFLPDICSRQCLVEVLCYTVALVGLAVCGAISTIIDPSDPALKQQRIPDLKTQQIPAKRHPKTCTLCRTRVEATSKHCMKCNRCTADFDHHCKWLNNCVGRANYRWFLALVVSVEIVSLLQVYLGAHVLYESVRSEEIWAVCATQRYRYIELAYFLISAMGVVSLVFVPVAVSAAYLLGFHVLLNLRKQSTYAYILAQRVKQSKVMPVVGTVSRLSLHTKTIYINTPHPRKTSTSQQENEAQSIKNVDKTQDEEVENSING